MKIGLGFLHYGFFHNTSESTALKALGRSWMKLGHEVVFINRRRKIVDEHSLSQEFLDENFDLLPRAVDRADPKAKNLDVLFEIYDYHCAHNYSTNAKIKTGKLVWALSPLSKFHTEKLLSYRNPLFIEGRQSYEEAIGLGIDAHPSTTGVDHNIFNPGNSKRPTDITKFLWVGGCGTASAPDLTLKAYFQAFTFEDNVLLTMISPRNTVHRLAREMIKKDMAKGYKHPPLNFISADKLPGTMAQIYRNHDALVMPIRFHGACRPVSEAMACGTLVITTLWTGPANYASSNEVLSIDYELEDVRSSAKKLQKYAMMPWFTKYFDKFERDTTYMWAKPSVEHTAILMKNVHENNYDKGTAKKALIRAKTFNWDEIALNIAKVLEKCV